MADLRLRTALGPQVPKLGDRERGFASSIAKGSPHPFSVSRGETLWGHGLEPLPTVSPTNSPSVHQSRALQVEDIPVHGALGTQHSVALVCRRDSGDLTSPLQGPHRIVSMSLQGSGLVCRREEQGRQSQAWGQVPLLCMQAIPGPAICLTMRQPRSRENPALCASCGNVAMTRALGPVSRCGTASPILLCGAGGKRQQRHRGDLGLSELQPCPHPCWTHITLLIS